MGVDLQREIFMLYLYTNIIWQAITSVFKMPSQPVIENDTESLATGWFD